MRTTKIQDKVPKITNDARCTKFLKIKIISPLSDWGNARQPSAADFLRVCEGVNQLQTVNLSFGDAGDVVIHEIIESRRAKPIVVHKVVGADFNQC